MLSSPLKSFTPNTIIDPTRLRSLLADIRRNGSVICPGFIDERATGIAVPLRGAGNEVIGALSVIVPNEDGARMQVPALRAAARGITRATGMPAR